MATEPVPYQIWDGAGTLVQSGTQTRTLTADEADEQTIRANIAAAKTQLQTATQQVNAATTTTVVAALQAYAAANNAAWQALLPALKYIAERLAS